MTICVLLSSLTMAQQTQRIYLSGTGSDNTINWQFYCTAGNHSGKWTTIPVPANWELQGFGKYNYGFNKDSLKGKESGLYKHEFKVPPTYKGKVVQLVFEGVMTDAEVKVNGKLAGPIHQGAFYAFKYDITNLLNYNATNLLEVKVDKHSANASVNAAERKGDFWIFGGIFRPVYLEVMPVQHIASLATDAKANGTFTAKVKVENVSTGTLTAQLYTVNGQKAGTLISAKVGKGDSVVTIKTNLPSPKLWSPEAPNLYKVVFSLVQNGKVIHQLSKKIGFRTVEVKERDGVYVNGVKIKFKGVNRHSFWPTMGRALNKTRSIADVNLMKDMNMNAVRMSHYPPDDHFLDVCDSLGLFVMDELAGWHGHYDTPTGNKLVKEMLEHDQNHPSIVFWSNGNEGGHNRELDHWFTDLDIQKRPMVHPWEDFNGFDTQHYREYNYGIGNYRLGHSIQMPTEFLHGLYDGGHGASLDDYWNDMLQNPLSAGGFLWDFADQGVVRTDKNGMIDTEGDKGVDGIVGPYHEKEGSYFTIKEVWSPVFFEPQELTAGFDGRFNVENRYHFTNLNQCRFSWKLVNLHTKASQTGVSLSPNIKPAGKGSVKVDLPANWRNFDVLYVTAKDAYQRELFTWSFPITLPAAEVKKVIVTTGSQTPVLSDKDSLYVVSANGVQLSFSKNTGLLRQVKNAQGEIPFNDGPVIQQGATNFNGISARKDGSNIIIESKFDRKAAYNTMQWTVYPSGVVKLHVSYFPAEYLTDYIGLNFSFPESQIKGVEYMGKGPYRVWKNRLKGTQFGVWNKTYNNTETGEAWNYPEFKGYYATMYWCKFNMANQSFKVATETEDVFLRLFSPVPKNDKWGNYVIQFPSGDISFMQGIQAIGTKTQRADRSGPQAMKNVFYDYEKDPARALNLTLYFDFTGK